MRAIALLSLVVVLSGCITGGSGGGRSYSDTLESWIGAQEQELVASWGRPDDVYDFAAGGREITFIDRRYVNQIVYECQTSFTVDGQGTIVDWAYEGNDCG